MWLKAIFLVLVTFLSSNHSLSGQLVYWIEFASCTHKLRRIWTILLRSLGQQSEKHQFPNYQQPGI